MKAKQKTREIIYWSCGKDIKGHFHASEDFAQRCINKSLGTSFVTKCAQKLARNKQIVSLLAQGKRKAEVARSLGINASIVQRVERECMEICQSNPDGVYAETWRTIDGRYTNQTRGEFYLTISISISEMRSLVSIWVESKNDWWQFLDELSNKFIHRDGLPLYRISDNDIKAMFDARGSE